MMLRRSPETVPAELDAGELVSPARDPWWATYVALPFAVLFGVAALLGLYPHAGLFAVAMALPALLSGAARRAARRAGRWAVLGPWRWRVAVLGLLAAGWVWPRAGALLSCAVALPAAAPIVWAAVGVRLRRPRERKGLVKPGADEEWRRRVEDEWPITAARAGLANPDEPAELAVLAGPVELLAPGHVHYRLDVEPALLTPEDVSQRIPALVRRQRAGHIVVRPVDPNNPDLVDVWLWRGVHPLDVPVDWRDLRPIGSEPGEWVPIGRLATGGAAGRQLALRWRISTGYFGAPETGKTNTQRAMLKGCQVQGLPLAGGLHIVDPNGDFAPWAPVLGERYSRTPREARRMVARFAERVGERYDSLTHGETVTPAPGTPALLLVVGEWAPLRQVRAGFGKDDVAGIATDMRYVAGNGRRAAAAVHLADQLTQKDELGPLRDLLGQRLLHWVPEAAMVDPALGSGALDRGARAHELPASLKGAAYVLDVETRWPVLGRPAVIPVDEVADAFGLERVA